MADAEVPSTDVRGLPIITAEQARANLQSVKRQVLFLHAQADRALERGDVVEAFRLMGDVEYQVEWMRDRLAITEGGVLER